MTTLAERIEQANAALSQSRPWQAIAIAAVAYLEEKQRQQQRGDKGPPWDELGAFDPEYIDVMQTQAGVDPRNQ